MGNIVDSTVTRNTSTREDMKNIHFNFNVRKGRTYTLQFSKKGYEQAETTVRIPDNKRFTPRPFIVDPILMRKSAYMLGEAEVKASKVMMVMKGDTIVYNADAFQLSEGSMLDALIEQLPGAKLEDGGRITVNGHFISSLLVNGRDFFRGDPKIALDNLPAYIVDKIKVYQREPEDAAPRKWAELQKADDPWVLDVNLKRYYAQGWIPTPRRESAPTTGMRQGSSRCGSPTTPDWQHMRTSITSTGTKGPAGKGTGRRRRPYRAYRRSRRAGRNFLSAANVPR